MRLATNEIKGKTSAQGGKQPTRKLKSGSNLKAGETVTVTREPGLRGRGGVVVSPVRPGHGPRASARARAQNRQPEKTGAK